MCVPKELWRIVDAIYERGLDERDLFTAAGDPDEVYQIRECLDTGAPFDSFGVHSMTEVLTSFYGDLDAKGVMVSESDLRAKMIELVGVAKEQVFNEAN